MPDLRDRIRVRRTIGPRDFADDLNAWNGSMLGPAHTLKQSAFFREKNTSKKVEGLYYVGASTIPGIGLPMCLISAEVLLKRIHGDTSTEPLPTPPRPAPRDRAGDRLMPGVPYLAGLVVSLVGMTVLDARFRLFFWRAPWRAAAVMVVGVAFFMVWDVAGVAAGIFFIGPQTCSPGCSWRPRCRSRSSSSCCCSATRRWTSSASSGPWCSARPIGGAA